MEGWCDACGKRVPMSYRDAFKGNAPEWMRGHEGNGVGAGSRSWVWGLVSLALFLALGGTVAIIAVARAG